MPSSSLAPVTVREADPSEFAALGELTQLAFAMGPYGHLERSPERVELESNAGLRAREGHLLVAVDGETNELLGTATLATAASPLARQARHGEVEIRLVAVAPAARGRGVGQALLAASIELTAAWGAPALVLDTGPANITAQRNYLRAGFERIPPRNTEEEAGIGQPYAYRYAIEATGPVRIRLIRHDEFDEVATLTEAAYLHDYSVLPSEYRASLRDVRTRAIRDEVWVAEDAITGRIVGTVWTPRDGEQISDLARDGELSFRLLAVAENARGRGIGAALTHHVIGLGRLRGAKRIVLNSSAEMTPAHRLYERLGFERLVERGSIIDGDPGQSVELYAFGLDLDHGHDHGHG